MTETKVVEQNVILITKRREDCETPTLQYERFWGAVRRRRLTSVFRKVIRSLLKLIVSSSALLFERVRFVTTSKDAL